MKPVVPVFDQKQPTQKTKQEMHPKVPDKNEVEHEPTPTRRLNPPDTHTGKGKDTQKEANHDHYDQP